MKHKGHGWPHAEIEGVLLTGGASRRMGTDKAGLMVGERPLAELVAEELGRVCHWVTVLGRTRVGSLPFQMDEEEFAGPMSALARFSPTCPLVFVASCDLPLFRADLILALTSVLGDSDAALPILDGREQPLCALYRSSAILRIRDLGETRVMAWVRTLRVAYLTEAESPVVRAARNVNTPDELRAVLNVGNSDTVFESQ